MIMSGNVLVEKTLKYAREPDIVEKVFKRQVDDLYDALERDDIVNANRIIGAMGDYRNLLAVEPLTILLEYPEESIRSNCALALRKIGDKATAEPMVIDLKGQSVEAGEKAVEEIGDGERFNEQVDNLYDALDGDDIAAGNKIIEAMGESKNYLAVEPLTILLEYPEESIRGNCALALGKIGDKAATRPLIKALNDPSGEIQKKAAKALDDLWSSEEVNPLEVRISNIVDSIQRIRSRLAGLNDN